MPLRPLRRARASPHSFIAIMKDEHPGIIVFAIVSFGIFVLSMLFLVTVTIVGGPFATNHASVPREAGRPVAIVDKSCCNRLAIKCHLVPEDLAQSLQFIRYEPAAIRAMMDARRVEMSKDSPATGCDRRGCDCPGSVLSPPGFCIKRDDALKNMRTRWKYSKEWQVFSDDGEEFYLTRAPLFRKYTRGGTHISVPHARMYRDCELYTVYFTGAFQVLRSSNVFIVLFTCTKTCVHAHVGCWVSAVLLIEKVAMIIILSVLVRRAK